MKYIYNPVTNNLDKTADIKADGGIVSKEPGLFENLPILNQGINAPKKPLEVNHTLNLPKSSKVKKKISTEKPTYFFDTPEGVDHVTKTLSTFENMKPGEAQLLNKEIKLGVLNSEVKGLKKFDNMDPYSFPSDPEQGRRLRNIQNLEKNLGYTYNPKPEPKKNIAQVNRENFLAKKKEREHKAYMEKEYGEKTMNNRLVQKIARNKKAGRADYQDFATHDIISAETMKDKAKKYLKENKPAKLDMAEIESGFRQIEDTRKVLNDLRRSDEEAKLRYQQKINGPNRDDYRGLGSLLGEKE